MIRIAPYAALAQRTFRLQLTYRAATLAGLATNFFFGLLRAAVMVALYGSLQSVEGITLQGAITYTALSQAVIAYLSIFSWLEVMNRVYSGEIGVDLLKPVGIFRYWMARDFGRALAQLLLRGLPVIAAYALFIGIDFPRGALNWVFLILALVLAWSVSFSWRFLVNLAAFWVPDARGIARYFFLFSWFLSGFMMPLRFLPPWFQRICYLTPFPHMVNSVVEIYLGLLDTPGTLRLLGMQFVWFLGLAGIAYLVLRAGIRRLVIQGG